jgi:hypothetical protein
MMRRRDRVELLQGTLDLLVLRIRLFGNTFNGTLDETGTRIKGRCTAAGKDGSYTAMKSE